MSTTTAEGTRSPAEFLALVQRSEVKYEYFDGEVYEWQAMAGTTDEHAAIAGNVQRELDNAFIAADKPCATLPSDAYVAIPGERKYRLPDVTVQCGPPEYDEEFRLARTNPQVLVEVISDSSRGADLGAKFKQYSKLASLREYVIFEQDFPNCRVHSRASADAPWTIVVYFVLASEVYIPSLDIRVQLAKFYRNIVWRDEGAKFLPGAGLPSSPDAGDA